ncbi:MAG: EamA family transporter [Verrucomicrobiae bacterium]|nr:EamA family transporter [Verrucomicrobiae bacterium]
MKSEALALAPGAKHGSGKPPAARGSLHPYLQILFGAVAVTLSELLLKRGAAQTAAEAGRVDWTGINSLGSGWVWLAILFYVLSFVSWLHVLRHVPLNVAFNLINITHVLVPVSSWIFLHERLPSIRWWGIALILIGITVIAKPLVRLEERL